MITPRKKTASYPPVFYPPVLVVSDCTLNTFTTYIIVSVLSNHILGLGVLERFAFHVNVN